MLLFRVCINIEITCKIQGQIAKTEQDFKILDFLEIEILPDLNHENQRNFKIQD